MSIIYSPSLRTYAALDAGGGLVAVYDPAQHGSLRSFREFAEGLI